MEHVVELLIHWVSPGISDGTVPRVLVCGLGPLTISMMFPPLYLHTPTIAPSSIACPPSGNGSRFLSPESHLLHILGCCQLSLGVVGVAGEGERGLVFLVPAVIYEKLG